MAMQYNRIFNFSAGPSMLPVPVLERCRDEMLNYRGSGMSVMEMSHRSKVFDEIAVNAQRLLREVMGIPDHYKVLFMQGGASLQFAAIPLNLRKNGRADYIRTGNFSTIASKEASKYLKVNIAATTEDSNFDHIPAQEELALDPQADYVHICMNNTIYGSRFSYIPETGAVPLAADLSSCILSEPIDVSKFGLIYAGVQKNIAPAGMAVVIIREDLLREPAPDLPIMLDYELMADKDSMYNTPNCWCIYVTGLVLEYIRSIGGVEEMARRNKKKADALYACLDESRLFHAAVWPGSRSMMNVTFRTGDDTLDAEFVKGAAERGMVNLKGHKKVGGMRASIYNNMPYEGVETLISYLKEFEAAHPAK